MSCVVDASVAVKWFVEEQDSRPALSLLDARIGLFAPDLILAEVGNAVWRKRRAGIVSEDQVRLVQQLLPVWFVDLVSLQQLSLDACELSLRLDHPIYDCIYLALGRRLNLPLVTFDHKLRKQVEQSETRVDCLSPDEYLAGRA